MGGHWVAMAAQGAGGFGPGLHHVLVVDGSADDPVDARGAQLGSIGDESRQVIDVAGGGERAGHGEEHDKARAEHGFAGGLAGAICSDELCRYRRNWTAAFDHIFSLPHSCCR